MQGGGAALAAKVNVDGEEQLAGATDGPPHSSNGLAAVAEGRIGGVNAAGVVLQHRALAVGTLKDRVGIESTAQVGLVELDNIGTVQVGDTDVTAGGTTVLVVDADNLGKIVHNAGKLLNDCSKGGQRNFSRHSAVVGLARVVLHLLEEDDVGSSHLGDDLLGNSGHVRGIGLEVPGVIAGHGDALAGSVAFKCNGREIGSRVSDGCNTSDRKYSVESKGVVHDTSDVAKVVAHLGIVGVSRTIEGSPDDDGLRVSICQTGY